MNRPTDPASGNARSKIDQTLQMVQADCVLVVDQHSRYFVVPRNQTNPLAFGLGSRSFTSWLRKTMHKQGIVLITEEIKEVCDQLGALAELHGQHRDVYLRVAPTVDGIELDVGDAEQTRIQVLPGQVNVIRTGSQTLFRRSPTVQALPMPSESGNWRRLLPYLNVSDEHKQLLIAWITYTLAHPKVPTTGFVILVLQGGQGSGKSTLAKQLRRLIDPSTAGIQIFPSSQQDLVIAANNAHLLLYDNVRRLTQQMADTLCICSTSGSLGTRKLYTDAEEFLHQLHVALVLNGIHPFIDQPDLADRCLTLQLLPLDRNKREGEAAMETRFQADLPVIFRGLLDLTAAIFQHLPTVTAQHPERMLGFCRWLAAMEVAIGKSSGSLQRSYSQNLRESLLDSLLDNPLAAAVLNLASQNRTTPWQGTPTLLLQTLSLDPAAHTRSSDWPRNAVSLSKRLNSMKAALATQGVDVDIGLRGNERQIVITFTQVTP